MRIKHFFKTRKAGVEYLQKRGWRVDKITEIGSAVLSHSEDTTNRRVYKVSYGVNVFINRKSMSRVKDLIHWKIDVI